MALTPLNTEVNQFPLSVTPHLSRVATHGNDYKNYTMLAFNPGYALQAAELNEIQELFFLNQSLTQRMNANWIRIDPTDTTIITAPFWEGLIPLNPNYITISNLTANASVVNFSYEVSEGWYLYTDTKSKLSFWTWNSNTLSDSVTVSTTIPVYFGIDNVGTSYVGCCQTDDNCLNQDKTLRDASQNFYQEFTCGASRFKVNLSDTLSSYTNTTGAAGNFAHIFVVDRAANVIKYPNNTVISRLI